MADLTSQLEALFQEVGQMHHEAFAETDGYDPEWSAWYAAYVVNRLPSIILGGMLTLPPYPEVTESLARLGAAGIRLATLTNSTAEGAEAQLTNAGLIDYFDQVLSVDSVRQFKPATKTYRMAARELGVEASDLRLVAAHDWDIAGALRAGWAAAFVARSGMVLGSLSQRPDIVGGDLREVVDQILAS